jgi:hypothetical protein
MEINYFCSLGFLCHSSYLLKRNNFKKCSYPFDWIYSQPNMIIDCIEDGFSKFLNKSYYTSNTETHGGHSLYGELMFAHHNPSKNEKDYEYFVRCVSRFKSLLTYSQPKLFSIFYVNLSSINADVRNQVIEFNNKLKNYTTNYTLLVIFNISNEQTNNHSFTYYENIHFLELHTISNSNGVHFINNQDDIYLDNIMISTYSFRQID